MSWLRKSCGRLWSEAIQNQSNSLNILKPLCDPGQDRAKRALAVSSAYNHYKSHHHDTREESEDVIARSQTF